MVNITKKGHELARKLNPSMGSTHAIARTCSLIARHATTHCKLQEMQCNGLTETQEEWVFKREEQIETRIRDLCEELPHVDGQPIRPVFQGDPRGATVKLKMPDGRYDDWGQTGLCVPGS